MNTTMTNKLQAASSQVQATGRRSFDGISDAAQRVRDGTSQAADAFVSYTKENPIKALMIAAASGALLLTLAKFLRSSRG